MTEIRDGVRFSGMETETLTPRFSPDFWTEERLNSVPGMMGKALASFTLDPNLGETELNTFMQSMLKDRSMDICDRVDVAMAAARGYVQKR